MSIERVLEFLQRPQMIKYQLIGIAAVCGSFDRLRADYETTYGDLQIRTDCPGCPTKFQWRKLPSLPRAIRWTRNLSSAYMGYITIKYLFKNQIDFLVRLFVDLERPIHCYLMGRYILHDSVAEPAAVLFSVCFLTWHILQTLLKPHRINLIYFMLQSDHDLDLVYTRLESERGLSLDWSQRGNRFKMPERFLLDVMCYRVAYPKRVVFRLRANRRREACLRMRRLLAVLFMVAATSLTVTTLIMWPTHVLIFLLDERYLRVYANCSPELEQAKLEGKLTAWSMTMTSHHQLTILFDQIENMVVWIECGLSIASVLILVSLLNIDLVIQWQGIQEKIVRLESISRQKRKQLNSNKNSSRPNQAKRNSGLQREDTRDNYELVAEMADFINQIETAGRFLVQYLNLGLIVLLIICALYSYSLQVYSVDQLPMPVLGIILTVLVCVFLVSYSYLLIHIMFVSSYTTFCSLMAHNCLYSVVNYGAILELYARRRECLQLMGQLRFTPTTLLSVISWILSGLCYITQNQMHREMVRRGKSLDLDL